VMLRTKHWQNCRRRQKNTGYLPGSPVWKVVVPNILSSILFISKQEIREVEELLLKLADYGLKNRFVWAGQFPIRGGILDIYSFGNEKPYRIDFSAMMWILSESLIRKHNGVKENYYR
jgi:hypothetical protein